jgi:tripartite-type tricarboxylate transporter receptor subunit TctC
MKLARAAALMAGALALSLGASAQGAYPSQAVKLVVPYQAGGATDVFARYIAERLAPVLGQPVLVDNRPGAGTMLASAFVAKAPADGHTLLLTNAALIQSPLLTGKASYDPIRDFAPVSYLSSAPLVLVVNEAVAVRDMAQFLAWARSRPEGLSYGTAGQGTTGHLYGEVLARQAALHLVHVPYKGDTGIVTDLLGGQVPAAFMSVTAARPLAQAGRIRMLAVLGEQRFAFVPEVPTFKEAGLAGFETPGMFGLLAPAKTPAAVVRRLSEEVNRILRSPEAAGRLQELGVVPAGSTPEAFAAILVQSHGRWQSIVRETRIRIE